MNDLTYYYPNGEKIEGKDSFIDYNKYRELLNKYFPEHKETRDIDCALWTYGHLFNDNEKNKKRYYKKEQVM